MTYSWTLVTRWTRRDWLAIAVVALAVAFLVGTSITVLATSATVSGEVENLDALEYAAYQGGGGAAAGQPTLVIASVETEDGTETTLVGVPNDTVELSSAFDDATLEAPPPGSGVGGPETGEVEFRGTAGTVPLTVAEPPQESVLPARWVATRPEAVREAGQTAEVTLGDGEQGVGIPAVGTLLLGTPAFLVGGGRALVELLALVTLASGLLVGVTVYSVTRMTVRDRRRALFVVRATGGGRRRLVELFAVRAGLLTGVGTLFGYSIGVILIHVILNVATYHGQLTTLDLSGTPTDRVVLGTMAVAVVLIGAGAGALSVARTALAEPGELRGASGNGGAATPGGFGARLRELLGLEILGVRSAVPMTATLSVFVAIAVLTASLGVTLAPLAGATDGVVMDPEADFPLESEVDQSLAEPFRAAGIPASPEVLLPQVRDGQPYLLRGVEYESFAAVSGVELVDGERPSEPDEAVVGTDLARTLGVEIGDEVTLGGGTDFGLDRVRIVGTFRGPGYVDDQLLVPLATAQGLANLDSTTVQVIRTTGAEVPPTAPDVGTPVADETPTASATPTPTETASSPTEMATDTPATTPSATAAPTPTATPTSTPTATATSTPTATPTPTPTPTPEPSEDIVIESVSVPTEGIVNTTIPIVVTLENRGDTDGMYDLDVTIGSTSETRRITVEAGATESTTFRGEFDQPGRYDVAINDVHREILIRRPANATVSPIPERAPPNATLLVTVRDANGDPLQGATVEIGPRAALTSGDGVASVPLPGETGTYPYEVRLGERIAANGTIRVEPDVERTLLANLTVEPEMVELPGTVEVTATVYNPWDETLAQSMVLEREGEAVFTGPVRLGPAGTTGLQFSVEPVTAAGDQEVVALFEGEQVGSATYTVEASDRLIALLARLGLYQPGSSLIRSLKALVGNLSLLQVTVFALAFLMGVGSTATVIVQGTHARRRSIGVRRVTGADARQLTKDLLLDGLQLGALASVAGTILGYAGLWVFVAAGYTTVFGVRLKPLLAPWLLGAVLLGALVLVAASSLVAAWWVLSLEPAALLTESTRRTPTEESEEPSVAAGGR